MVENIPKGDKRLEIIIDNLANRLTKIKTTFDRLLISLIILCIFAHVNRNAVSTVEIPLLKINISAGTAFLLVMSAIIIANFAVVGSTLVDYFSKRASLQEAVSKYLGDNYKSISENPAGMFVLNSFCEYLFQFEKLFAKKLYSIASVLLCAILLTSHYIVFLLLASAWKFWIATGCALIVFIPLYLTFFNSIMRAKKLAWGEPEIIMRSELSVQDRIKKLKWTYLSGFLVALLFVVAIVLASYYLWV